MSRITWGSPGTRLFEAGVDRGVFYPQVGPGLPWDGLISVKEDPSQAELKAFYVDGVPHRTRKTNEIFAAVLQAYTSPRGFEEYDGTSELANQQRRKPFGLSYRTLVGNDISGTDHAYLIHLVYNALAMPSTVDYGTTSPDGLNATPFSWGISTTPVKIPGAKPAAHLIIDTTVAYPEAVQAIEDVLYGSTNTEAHFPQPEELLELFEQHAILVIIDHGDGTWTAIGPDDVVYMTDANTFEINWPSVQYLDNNTYQVSSL